MNILVAGGGYAGVLAANRLSRHADVTLINPRDAFVERIRLHQLAAGTYDPVVPFDHVLSSRVRRITATVETISAPDRTVTLSTGAVLSYDYLVYAVGSGPAHSSSVADLSSAQRLFDTHADAVTVVGAGPTGIELAAELAEQGTTVTLIGPLNPYLHPRGRAVVADSLTRLGVSMVDARVTAVTADTVELADGSTRPSPVTVWTTGFAVPDLAARSGLTTDPAGRLLTDETLTSVDSPHIVAAGDCAAPSGRPLRMSCQAAGPLGMAAADTVIARLSGRDPRPFVMGFLGEGLSLGRRSGLFQMSGRDDVAVDRHLAGRAGARLKEFVCRSTVWQLGWEARHPGVLRIPAWMNDRSRRADYAPAS
ncbi:NAD(P)/FAD-dependent oxidoreductase [Paractinoplanes bogorensis]|nr:FAD-dependent oxidoreductase [Actinoplanes bogorensis]